MIKHIFEHAVVLLGVRRLLDGNPVPGLSRMCRSPNRYNCTPNWIKWILFNSCITGETVSRCVWEYVCEKQNMRKKINFAANTYLELFLHSRHFKFAWCTYYQTGHESQTTKFLQFRSSLFSGCHCYTQSLPFYHIYGRRIALALIFTDPLLL